MSDLAALRDRWREGNSSLDEEDMGNLINLALREIDILDALTRVWREAKLQPDRFREEMGDMLVRIAYEAGEITQAKAAELLGCSIIDIRRLGWKDDAEALRARLAAAERERDENYRLWKEACRVKDIRRVAAKGGRE